MNLSLLQTLPNGWNLIRLKWLLAAIESGRREVSDTEEFEDGVLSIGGEHIGWLGQWKLDNPRYVSHEFFAKMSTGRIQKNDLLLVKDGATIGKVAIAEQLPAGESAVNEHVFLLRFTANNYPKFYFYFIQSSLAQNQIWLEVRGSAQPGLNTEFRSLVIVPQPPKEQQYAIANFLDQETAKIDALISAKERLLGLLAEKRKALITHAVTRGLNPAASFHNSGIPWLGEIPVHWPMKRAKFLFKQSALPIRDEDEMVTCFRDGQVTLRKNRREEGFTNAVKELGYQGIRAGQLVLHSMDAFAGAIGVSDSEGKCTPEYIICDPLFDNISTPYYGYLLRLMALNGFVQASCAAVRERAPRIRFADFGEMFIPLPPFPEQLAIIDHIKRETARLDALREATVRTIGLSKERRAALIAAAVTGQIEV